jgi:hypothetical protein
MCEKTKVRPRQEKQSDHLFGKSYMHVSVRVLSVRYEQYHRVQLFYKAFVNQQSTFFRIFNIQEHEPSTVDPCCACARE